MRNIKRQKEIKAFLIETFGETKGTALSIRHGEALDALIESEKDKSKGQRKALAQPLYDGKERCTANLHVEDSCIGCGLCGKKCPVQAIEMRNKRPVWVKEKCAMCLGCLHRCPKFAIQYGRKTKTHGQYTNPHVKV